MVAALSASYVNAVNLGLPIAVFVLGDGAIVAPALLFQLVVLAPVAVGVLDARRRAVGDSRRIHRHLWPHAVDDGRRRARLQRRQLANGHAARCGRRSRAALPGAVCGCAS